MLVPTTLAVLGILSSCPRVMTMQCWKSQIPPPLSTRLRIYCFGCFGFVPAKRKETRLSKIPQRNKNSKTSEKPTLHISQIIPKFKENQNHYPKCQNNNKIYQHETAAYGRILETLEVHLPRGIVTPKTVPTGFYSKSKEIMKNEHVFRKGCV